MTDTTAQLYRVYIKATPERVWEAITQPDDSAQYFYGARITNTAEGHEALSPDGEDWGSGATLEFDPPRRLVYEWLSSWDPDATGEPVSRVTWELEEAGPGVTMLTLTHDRLEASPNTADSVRGGWAFVLSSLKSLLETGVALPAAMQDA